MARYRQGSGWNDKNEMKCLLILKKLQKEHFRHGLQATLCQEMAWETGLSPGTIHRKVGNYKSEAGIAGPTNSSSATKEMYRKYKNHSVSELEREIDKL